jgi:hypothetical protein
MPGTISLKGFELLTDRGSRLTRLIDLPMTGKANDVEQG